MLTSTSESGLWPALGHADLALVDWTAIALQLPALLMLVLVALIVVIMNLAGLEITSNQDLDWNREFRATGLASVVAAMGGGGTVASMIVPASLRSKWFGAATRLTGIIAALVIAGTLFLGDGLLELVPVPLVGGILLFAGLGMLDEGLVKSRRRLPWTEYGVIVLIAGTTVVFGLLEGVAAGMLSALVFFVVRLSRVDLIASRLTLRERSSTKARSIPDRVILQEEGKRVLVWRIRGYIFFGSAYTLGDQLMQTLSGDSQPSCIVLDFTDVSGFDFSAVNAITRFQQSAKAAGVTVVLSAPSEQVRASLERNLSSSEFATLRVEPNLDHALEHCEEIIIEAWKTNTDWGDEQHSMVLERAAPELDSHLERRVRFEELASELRSWVSLCRYATGEAIAGLGAMRPGLQLLTAGRASAIGAKGTRVRQYSPGDAIWPVDPAEDKVVAVSADTPCTTMVLTPDARRRLEKHEVQLTLNLYRYLLAERFQGESTGFSPKEAVDPGSGYQ